MTDDTHDRDRRHPAAISKRRSSWTPPSPEQRRAALELKVSRALAALKRLDAQDRKENRRRDTRKKIVVGGTVLAAMRVDAGFERYVLRLLRNRVTRPQDRDAVADLTDGG